MMKKKTNNMIRGFTGLMVGIPLLGAAAGQISQLPQGMAKKISGAAVGIGSVGLLSHSMKNVSFNPKK